METFDSLTNLTVVEVAMEIALTPEILSRIQERHGYRPTRDAAMSTSVGGIGPLLRERIVAQAARGINVIGVTLLYENTWIQSWFEWGQLHLEQRNVSSYLRNFLTDTNIVLNLPMYNGETTAIRVWMAEYGKAKVYFLDCPPITQVVYPNEEDAPPKSPNAAQWAEDLRQQQNWLIGRGSLALLKELNQKPDIIVQSETPTVFAHHRLIQDAFQHDPFFEKTKYIFNDHTPMEYAHPVWQAETLKRLKIDTHLYQPISGNPNPSEADITRLLVGAVDGVFGVSEKHGRVMRAMPSLRDFASKIEHITNGVLVDYWQAAEYKKLASLSDDELLQLKDRKKSDLLDWVWRHFGLWHTWKDQVHDKGVVLWMRRITGYKRLDILAAISGDARMKKQFLDLNLVLLIGGRIHQHDDHAQTMVYNLLDQISLDPMLQERIVFLDNFNVWMAPRPFQGSDAAIMLADDGREASATGFMKAQVNGNIILATDDGAIPESVIFSGKEQPGQEANGFEVPYVWGRPTAEGFLNALRNLQQTLNTPKRRAAMIRSAFTAEPRVSIERTVDETLAFYKRVMAKPVEVH
jgi:starch phosphorylase